MSLAAPTPAVTDFGSLAALKTAARAKDPDSVRKAAQQFEALFTQQLLKSARAANLGDDILGGGQTGFYQDMFDQQMALHMASGKGMGLADVLVKQMLGSTAAAPTDPLSLPNLLPPARQQGSVGAGMVGVEQQASAQVGVGASGPGAVAVSRPSPALPASAGGTNDPGKFIDQIKPHAVRAARELGVPAEAIMAQAALETGWGKSVPARADGSSSHNLFGIKATRDWDGARLEKTTHEHLGGRMQKVSAEFRAYGSVGEAFDDYVSFLKSNPRYAAALRQGDDAAGFARGLQQAGYATDPDYAAKLLKLAGGVTISRAGDHSVPEASA